MAFDPELRKQQVYGLLMLVLILVAVGIARSSMHELFPPGWWRLW